MINVIKYLYTIILLGLVAGCQRGLQIDIFQYYNYSIVDWERLDTLYYRPYAADWSEDIGRRIYPDFPQEIAAEYWHSLQNAKTDFHQHSLPLRATSSPAVGEALDRAEAAFDTVFVRCVEQEYYMRLFSMYIMRLCRRPLMICTARWPQTEKIIKYTRRIANHPQLPDISPYGPFV